MWARWASALAVAMMVLSGCSGPDEVPVETLQPTDTARGGGDAATTGTILGQVVDDESRPVAGATAAIVALEVELTTGPNGTFTVTDVPSGKHALVVQKLGYESQARSVDVAAGQEVSIQIALVPLSLIEPFHTSYNHVALHNAGPTLVTFGLQLAGVPGCESCSWTDTPPKGPDAMLIEIQGAHTITNPDGDKEYFWMFKDENLQANHIFTSEQALPARHVETNSNELFAETENFWTQLLCEYAWVCFNERRDVWTTFFYHQDVPDDWTAFPVE